MKSNTEIYKNLKLLEDYGTYLIEWIKLKVQQANKKGVIVGISGGIDSALVACLAKKAFPENSLGITMPIGNSMKLDFDDIAKLQKLTKLEIINIDLTLSYDALAKTLDVKNKLAKANIKPRLRMASLYAMAQEKDYLVLGTDNLDEWYLGYFTKYGDGGVDLLPISYLTKSEVISLAQIYKVDKGIIEKKPSAGLWENQEDEKELGYSYSEVDLFLRKKQIDSQIATKIEKQHQMTEHKRQLASKPMDIVDFENKER
ncbi:NH(3)-DEPENDENT NAD(+) SYNTHETASE [Mycoplasmopsis pulmonis]|uniref:NH(3)-dependent NAD(+) synthetase n=1 Tax=Mycoplasmopsis pulmonis (strain UAB CTIP) TaxID=272635 RepID=NADE_MYCPU|nr:NAD(+) synthase [Mycoplasmopsis pulmonis]Q98PU6.1 RecName: Full=NH(3)-dependent NAD(+) synthetase [Mycoplasmopsis pulmonis UAB CTIP]CAC13796.1 NH(3)-DEPENDENT NAD(+) SYNTHETASE [Mycoplasmopsis pulmonis]